MAVRTEKNRTLSTRELADWIERSPTDLWMVDGDHRLTRELDFPCPRDELARGLRSHGESIRVLSTGWGGPEAHEFSIPDDPLGDLPGVKGRSTFRTLHLAWADKGDDSWMLYEYLPVFWNESGD